MSALIGSAVIAVATLVFVIYVCLGPGKAFGEDSHGWCLTMRPLAPQPWTPPQKEEES